jgi:dCTP deaminase
MVLSDKDIRSSIKSGKIEIDPYDEQNIEPASVDLRIGSEFKVARKSHRYSTVDLGSNETDAIQYVHKDGSVTIHPEMFVLATSMEKIMLSDEIVAHVLGRSSLGRLGISVHQTAGYIDPGFEGQITLELSNHGPAPVHISHGQRICQIVFEELSSSAEEPYGHSGSQYQNQSGATESGMEFD